MTNPALLDAVLTRSTGKGSRIHGPTHWAGVAAAGLTLLDSTPDADPLVVLLFALFHDSMRLSDGHDPGHGARGAKLARRMRGAGDFELEEARLLKLEEACTRHDKGTTSMDPTVGVCWDADRLNLRRLLRTPNPGLLSTAAARRVAERVARKVSPAWPFQSVLFDWRALFAEYAAKRDSRCAYLRFGGLPAGGRSWAGLWALEGGVSVYPGQALEDGSYTLDLERLVLGIDTRFLSVLLWKARPLYVVEGRLVGIGKMGEPVLEDARIIKEVSPHKVDVRPGRPRFRKLLQAWRSKREGKDPGVTAFHGAKEPDERPFFPVTGEGRNS